MNKVKNFISAFFAVILLICIIYPVNADAAEVGKEDTLQLFETVEKVELGNISVLEGTTFYGYKQGNEVTLQFSNTYTTVLLEKVKEVGKSEEIPEVIDGLSKQDSSKISAGAFLYLSSSTKKPVAVIEQDIDYPVYQNDNGNQVLYIGGRELFLGEDMKAESQDVALDENIVGNDTEEIEKVVDSSSTDIAASNPNVNGDSEFLEANEVENEIDEEIKEEDKVVSENNSLLEEEENGEKNSGKPSNDNSSQSLQNVEEWEEPSPDQDTVQIKQSNVTESKSDNSKIVANNTGDIWKQIDYFKVEKESLTVFDNRSSGPLKPIGELKKGQVYKIVSDYGNWHKIQFGNFYGYVKKSDTMPNDGSELKNENKIYNNQSRTFSALQDVTVYDNTSGSLVPFGQIDKGTNYSIASDYGNWWRVLLAGRVGYVRKEEVRAEFQDGDKNFRVHTDNLPVYDNRRSGPLEKVGELKKGETYSIVSSYGNWWRVQYGDFYGYVKKADTGYATNSEIANPNKGSSDTSHKLVPTKQVNVYDNSSKNLTPFGKIEKGVAFPIATDYGNWWRISYLDRIGYIRKSEVEIQYASFNKYFKADENQPVYDNRDSSKLKKVGELEKGESYSIISDYGNWHRIQFGDIYGYVSKFDTTPSTKSAIKNLNEGYKNTSRTFETLKDVTVYDNSSGSIVPFAQLDKGTNFTIAADYGSWWRVLFADRVGYVKKGEVKAEFKDGDSFFRVFREGKPVYDNRKGYLIEVSDLNKNQVYRISSDYGNWWRVQFGNDFGFVRKADTGYATIKEIRNFNQTYKNTNKKFIIANDTKVYDNTSGSLVPFGELKVGSAFPIASDYGNWWRIIYLGRIGYVNKNDSLIYREYSIEETVDQYKNKDTRNTLKRIETFFISPSSNYLLSADAMLEDKFRISDYGTFDFSNGIPWGEDPIEGKSFSRSYYRSLHAQFFINDLIAAYKETANEEYIYKGYEIINDWIINNPYTNSEHKLAWHDEGSARRLITWVNFYNEARNILEDKQLQYLLSSMTEHADILLMDSFHTTNTNHGMYQDEALIVFSDYFKDLPKSQLYNQIGKKRLKSYFDYIISEEGVHLEHSPGYHQIIAKSVKGYKNYFNLMGDYDQFNYYNQLYNSMANYYVWLVKPDGSLPLIGDTFSNVVPPDSLWEDNNYYKYAISQGEKGIKPPTHSAVFEDAGYAIFRDDWEVGSNSTYIHFTAAYHTEYHKHSDDLSLWIYANGHDIITEAGPNGYDYDLPFTEFAYSSYAHNTLIVNDKGLPRIDGKYEDTHILDYNLGERVSQVSGINNRYDNVSHQRELEYNRDDKIVKVNDKITSDKRNNYKLLWNLAEGVRPEINGNSINLFVEDVLVMNLEINSESELEIYEKKGEKDPSIIGWHFEDRNKPVETHTIVIESSEVNADIESVFTIK